MLSIQFLDTWTDLLNIDNIHLEQMVHRTYAAELQLNKANASDTEAAFLEFNLSIHNDSVSTKILISRFLMAMSLDVPLMCIYISTYSLLKQGYRYHKPCKAFSKFDRRHFELIEKYHVSLKKLMQQGICNPEFYGDFVYKFKKIIGNPNFSDLFKHIVNRFKRAGYTLDIMRQTACLVFNPIMVEGYAVRSQTQ